MPIASIRASGCPDSATTSQRAGVHERGSRPDVSLTTRASESTAAICTRPPRRCSERKATERETAPPTGRSATRAARSYAANEPPGEMPDQPTRTERWAWGSAAIVR